VPKFSKRAAVLEFLRNLSGPVTEHAYRELLDRLAPVSADYLRDVLRESGYPLAPMVEGVRQSSFEELERTLLALAVEYESAVQGERERRSEVRALVVAAKDRARFAGRRTSSEEKKDQKAEMVLWLMTWLENPGLFDAWVRVRKSTPQFQTRFSS
jgi:hypothetical protein